MSRYKPRIAAAPVRVQMVKADQIHQAQRIGATARARGRARQEARLRIWLRDGPNCAACGEVVDITPGTDRPFELDHIVPLWAGGKDIDSNRQCLCVTYDADGGKRGCHVEKTAREAVDRSMADRRV